MSYGFLCFMLEFHWLLIKKWGTIMPRQRNRVNLTLSDEMFDLLSELSKLSKTPRAALIAELLDDVKPHLQKSVDLIKLLKQEKLTMTEVRAFYVDMVADASITTAEALKEINKPTEAEKAKLTKPEENKHVTDNGASD